MESMGKAQRRRSFTPEFKAEIIELCQRGDRSIGQVVSDFDLTETAVRGVGQAGRTVSPAVAPGGSGVSSSSGVGVAGQVLRARHPGQGLRHAAQLFHTRQGAER
jgi:transposase